MNYFIVLDGFFYMTSVERREVRYQKRKAKRLLKKKLFMDNFNSLSIIYDMNNLYKSAIKSKRGVYWKNSVQKYSMNRLKNMYSSMFDIKNGRNIKKGTCNFTIYERGKRRNISSVHVYERVIHKSLNTGIIVPVITRNLIYDNGACIKHKGILFAQTRIEKHLRDFYKKHGNKGYIQLIDFSNYFGNISHDEIRRILVEKGLSSEIIDFTMFLIENNDNKGLGLGSEISQTLAVGYPNEVDHFIKDKLGIKYYGRYMDDSYIISDDKNALKKYLDLITPLYEKLGIILNKKKTNIYKLDKGFNFLKCQYILTDTGKIIKKPNKKTIAIQRRKLKKFKKFYLRGEMTMEQIYNSYMSWRSFISNKNAHFAIRNMDKLYAKLFIENKG